MTLSMPTGDSVAGLIRLAHQSMLDTKERLQRGAGVQPEWLPVMLNVRVSPGTSLSKLARLLRLPQKSVEKLLAEIESAGLIERRWHPVREQIYELHVSEKGKEALASVDSIDEILEQQLAAYLGQEDVDRFHAVAGRIVIFLTEQDASVSSKGTNRVNT